MLDEVVLVFSTGVKGNNIGSGCGDSIWVVVEVVKSLMVVVVMISEVTQ